MNSLLSVQLPTRYIKATPTDFVVPIPVMYCVRTVPRMALDDSLPLEPVFMLDRVEKGIKLNVSFSACFMCEMGG